MSAEIALLVIAKSPVPEGCTMAGLPYMPLYIERLQGSKSWIRAARQPHNGFFLVNLWMAAWQGTPAGSLEDDDDILAAAAKCEIGLWPEVRAEVLRGWLRCEFDGRLYHPAVCEMATEAWAGRQKFRDGMARSRAAKLAKRARSTEPRQPNLPLTPMADSFRNPEEKIDILNDANDLDEIRPLKCESTKEEEERAVLRTEPCGSGEQEKPKPKNLISGARAELWCDGLATVRTLTGLSEGKARRLLGKVLKAADDDCALVLDILSEARDFGPLDPTAWLLAAAENRADRGTNEVSRWLRDSGLTIDDVPDWNGNLDGSDQAHSPLARLA